MLNINYQKFWLNLFFKVVNFGVGVGGVYDLNIVYGRNYCCTKHNPPPPRILLPTPQISGKISKFSKAGKLLALKSIPLLVNFFQWEN